MYICLPNIINPMYIEQLGEMVPPPGQNIVGVYNQITPLILYYISSRLVKVKESCYRPGVAQRVPGS